MAFMGVAEGEGAMGGMAVAAGEMGLSRRFGGDLETMVAFEACMASNALILALTAEDAIAAGGMALGGGGCRGSVRERAEAVFGEWMNSFPPRPTGTRGKDRPPILAHTIL